MDERISNFVQMASVRRYEMSEGRERGLKIIDCDNGRLRFLVNESKAADIAQLYHKGKNISFLSKNGLVAKEKPFASRFEGGMVYTCGLDSVGSREGFPTHGTLHNTPALITQATCGEEGITVEAETVCTSLFGENLVLRRRITTALGSGTIEIHDNLENRAFRDENYCLLYHVNLGYPFLDEGCKITGSIESCTPRTSWAASNEVLREVIGRPVPNEEEMCYFLRFKTPEVSVANEKTGERFTLSWSADTLPHFVQWKSMASGDWALGLEPCTTELDDGFRYSVLKPGERKAFSLTLSLN